MLTHRTFVDGLAQTSYLVACERDKVALVVDPQRDVTPYLEQAERFGVTIAHVLLTHVHADFVAGHRELVDRCGAKVWISRAARAAFPHEGLAHGDRIGVGGLEVRALATPGHTPESMCFHVRCPRTGEAHLYTGDTLFVGDVGRPDLLGNEQAAPLARSLYESITRELWPLGDGIVVAPGHGAGSLCGKNLSRQPFSTLGHERAHNCALAGKDADRFVADLLDGLPAAPAHFARIATTNRQGPRLVRELPLPRALHADEVERELARGALVVDVRPTEAFQAAHIPGSLFLGPAPSSQLWATWLLPHDQDLILLATDTAEAHEARRKLLRVGFDRVIGFVNCGIDAWERHGGDLGCLRDLVPEDHAHLRELGDAPALLDVRQPGEWAESHPHGARHQPLGRLPEIAAALRDDGPLAVICATGYRSVIACSVLLRAGKRDVLNIPGGFRAWRAAGCPVES